MSGKKDSILWSLKPDASKGQGWPTQREADLTSLEKCAANNAEEQSNGSEQDS